MTDFHQSALPARLLLAVLLILTGCQVRGPDRSDPGVELGMTSKEASQALLQHSYNQTTADCQGDICAEYWNAGLPDLPPGIFAFYQDQKLLTYFYDFGEFTTPAFCETAFKKIMTDLSAKYGVPQVANTDDSRAERQTATWRGAAVYAVASYRLVPLPSLAVQTSPAPLQCERVYAKVFAGSEQEADDFDRYLKHRLK